MTLPPDVLEKVWTEAVETHDPLAVWDIGSYIEKDTTDVPALLRWAPQLTVMLDYCSNGIVCWENLRGSLRSFFMKRPRTDPFMKKDGVDTSMAAELCATGFKRLMGSLRRAALYPDKQQAMLRKCKGPEAAKTIQDLLAKICMETKSEDEVVEVQQQTKKLEKHISLESGSDSEEKDFGIDLELLGGSGLGGKDIQEDTMAKQGV